MACSGKVRPARLLEASHRRRTSSTHILRTSSISIHSPIISIGAHDMCGCFAIVVVLYLCVT